MKILDTKIVQRAYDGRWEKIAKILDHENSYSYREDTGKTTYSVPSKWITITVFDFIMEEV